MITLDCEFSIKPQYGNITFSTRQRTVNNQHVPWLNTIADHAVAHRPNEVRGLGIYDAQIVASTSTITETC